MPKCRDTPTTSGERYGEIEHNGGKVRPIQIQRWRGSSGNVRLSDLPMSSLSANAPQVMRHYHMCSPRPVGWLCGTVVECRSLSLSCARPAADG